MRFPIIGAENSSPSSSATNYVPLATSYATAWNATENLRQEVIAASTGTDLKVFVDTAPGVGKSWVFTVRKNGAGTALTVTISDTNTSASISGQSVSFSDLDLVTLESVPSGTPTAPGKVYWYTMVETATQSCFIIGTSANASASATQYAIPSGNSSVWETSAATPPLVFGAAGNLTKLLVALPVGSPGGSGKSYAASARVQNTTDALTTTLSNTATTGSTSGTQAISAGDAVVLKCVPAGTPTVRRLTWCLIFEPTTAGEMPLGWYTTVDPANATTYDLPYGDGGGAFNATETTRQMKLPASILRSLYELLAPASGAGTSRTTTIRKNASNSALAVTLSNASTGTLTGTDVTVADGDLISLQQSVSGSPTAATIIRVGYVLVIPVAASPAPSTVAGVTTVGAATVTASTTPTPAVVAAVASIGAAVVTTGSTVQPVTVAGVTSVGTATVTTTSGASVTPAVIACVTTIGSPSLVTDEVESAVVVACVTTIGLPSIQTGTSASPATVAAVTSIGAPAVSGSSGASISATTVRGRATVGAFPAYVDIPDSDGNYVETADQASLHITGDIDVRVALAPDVWSSTPGGINNVLLQKVSAGLCWRFLGLTDGSVYWNWKESGGAETESVGNIGSHADGALLLARVTHDVDNGSGQNVVRYYSKASTVEQAYADTISDSGWTLGSTDTISGTTNIRSNASTVGFAAQTTASWRTSGKFYAVCIKDGINGTIVAAADFSTATAMPLVEHGNSWSLSGSATLAAAAAGPTIATGSTASPATVACITSIGAPATSTGQTVTPATVGATASIGAPATSTGQTVTPATVACTSTIGLPSIQTGTSASPATIAAAVAVGAPVIFSGSTEPAATIAAVVTIPTPSLRVGSTVSAVTVQVVATVGVATAGAAFVVLGPTGVQLVDRGNRGVVMVDSGTRRVTVLEDSREVVVL